MTTETFSFRWGIPFLDADFTQFPNAFWQRYHQVISRNEWLFVCHLATFKYESAQGACSPSLETVAVQMGYADVRSVQKLRQSLEDRGFLKVHYRSGQTSIYDFSGLSTRLLQLSCEKGGESQFTRGVNPSSPHGESQFTRGVNPSSPKEEKRTRTEKEVEENAGADAPVSPPASEADELFPEPEKREKRPSELRAFKVGTDPALDLVRASDLSKERGVPGWAVLGAEGPHPAFPVVKAFCDLTGQSPETLGEKRGKMLLRQYEKLAEEHELDVHHMVQAHRILPGEHWGAWCLENHKWSTGFEDSYANQLVLAAAWVRDGRLEVDRNGEIVDNAPAEELTGLGLALARQRERQQAHAIPERTADDNAG